MNIEQIGLWAVIVIMVSFTVISLWETQQAFKSKTRIGDSLFHLSIMAVWWVCFLKVITLA